jgi:putative ABC transport system substrate-binding protein
MKRLFAASSFILILIFTLTGSVQAASICVVSNEKIPAIATLTETFKNTLQFGLDKASFSSVASDASANISGTDFNSFDLVFVTSGEAIKIIEPRTQKPVVFSIIFDPNVHSLGVSGQNIAGIALSVSPEQHIAAIKEILPSVKTVAVFYSSGMSGFISNVGPIFERAGLSLKAIPVNSFDKIPHAIEGMKNSVDLFWLIPDPVLYNSESIPYVLTNCADNHIPVMGFGSNVTKAGALFSCSYNFEDVGRQAGEIALRILNGENPGSIGIISPRRVTYSFNKKIKDYLGVSIAPSVWSKAQDIF